MNGTNSLTMVVSSQPVMLIKASESVFVDMSRMPNPDVLRKIAERILEYEAQKEGKNGQEESAS